MENNRSQESERTSCILDYTSNITIYFSRLLITPNLTVFGKQLPGIIPIPGRSLPLHYHLIA